MGEKDGEGDGDMDGDQNCTKHTMDALRAYIGTTYGCSTWRGALRAMVVQGTRFAEQKGFLQVGGWYCVGDQRRGMFRPECERCGSR
jgi:hypothetical protein